MLCIGSIQLLWGTTDKYRLMFNGNPSTEVTLGFNASNISNNPLVYYSTSLIEVNNLSSYPVKTPYRKEEAYGMVNCFVHFTNLSPNQRYYLVVKDHNSISEVYHFETISTSNNTNLSILAGSDSRNNFEVRRTANKIVGKLCAHAILFGGDMTDNGTSEEWERWLNDWQLTISETNRLTPLIICRGNHESNNAMLQHLFDTNPEVYYANTFGGNLLRTYTLNSETALYGSQTDWLENDLNNHQNVTWKFVQYHTPMRPHVITKSEGARQYARWANLFYQNSVDIVMEGDAHTVKTTWPLIPCSGGFDCYQGFRRDDKAGITFIGEGTYASPLRANSDIKPWTRASGEFFQFKWLFVNKEKIEIRTIVYDDITDTDAIESLTPSNRFIVPQNLDIWNPPNGAVITLHNSTSNVPECNLIQPSNNSMHQKFDNVLISAAAGGAANIAQVEVYINGSLNTTIYNAPYNYYWQPAIEGNYIISVIAKDTNGLSSTMSLSAVSVGPRTNVLHAAKININSDEYFETLTTGAINTMRFKNKICDNNKYLQGFRFTGLNIPKNSIIESARILFETAGGGGQADAQIWAEKNAYSVPFFNEKYNISQRQKTTNLVNWNNIPDWFDTPSIADRTTPDLSSIIQELVNQPDWRIESPIVFLIKGTGIREVKSFYSLDHRGRPYDVGAPTLSIQYSMRPCASCVTINNSELPENDYHTKDCIITNTAIPAYAQQVEYSAKSEVQLNSGFSVTIGTNLTINNDGCQ